MADDPQKQVLLDGVARFLVEQVLPATTDKGLAFRVRIAAHLLGIVSREVQAGVDEDPAAVAAAADAIRAGTFDDVWLQQHLADKLAVSNPRFSLDLETGEDPWTL